LAIVIQQNRKSGGSVGCNPPEKEKAGGLGGATPQEDKRNEESKKI